MTRVYKHTSVFVLSRRQDRPKDAKTDLKMPRPKVSSEEKNLSASQDESGATTTADPMSEFLTIMLKKFEEVNMQFEKLDKLLIRRGNKLDDKVKETRNTNQRRAGLQHQAQRPRLAMKANVLEDKKTRESTEDFAQDGST